MIEFAHDPWLVIFMAHIIQFSKILECLSILQKCLLFFFQTIILKIVWFFYGVYFDPKFWKVKDQLLKFIYNFYRPFM